MSDQAVQEAQEQMQKVLAKLNSDQVAAFWALQSASPSTPTAPPGSESESSPGTTINQQSLLNVPSPAPTAETSAVEIKKYRRKKGGFRHWTPQQKKQHREEQENKKAASIIYHYLHQPKTLNNRSYNGKKNKPNALISTPPLPQNQNEDAKKESNLPAKPVNTGNTDTMHVE